MDLLGVGDIDDDVGQMKGIMRYGKGGVMVLFPLKTSQKPWPSLFQSEIVLGKKNISCSLFWYRGYFECLAVVKSGSSGCRY